MFYYKIIGHLEDEEQEVGTFIFSDEPCTNYLEEKFKKELLLNGGYDLDSNREVYIDYIFYSHSQITQEKQ
tara:strand:- start:243 stop:455 length:213 start_codon:yes stop_codon:yes gene_type:complete